MKDQTARALLNLSTKLREAYETAIYDNEIHASEKIMECLTTIDTLIR